jgi:hypothetical protein
MRRLILITMMIATACGGGGGGASGPSPLKHVIDEVSIARVPSEGKPQVFAAQQEWDVAKSDKATADTNVTEVGTEISVAQDEAKQAGLAENSAKTKQKAAAGSGDVNRQNVAANDVRAAGLGEDTAAAKVAYLMAKRDYLKKVARAADFNVLAKQAKFELEKAKVAKANNIQPVGFVFDDFDVQFKDRTEAATKAKADADSEKQRAESKKADWKQKEKDWYAAKGEQPPQDIKPPPVDKAPPPPGDKGAPDVIR